MTSYAIDGSGSPINVSINGNHVGRAKSMEVEFKTDEEDISDIGYVAARSVVRSYDLTIEMDGVSIDVRPVSPPGAMSGARPAIVIEDEVTSWADPDADPVGDVLRTAGDVLRSSRGWGKSAPATATYPTVSVPPAGSHASSTFGSWFGPSSGGASSGALWHADPEPELESLGDLMSELIIDKARLIWVDDPGEWQLELALRHIDNGTIVTVEVPFNSPLVINDLVDALETYAEETDDD